ncbi:unnamed protein product [Schistosoma margrebowiei]|uniref:Uncharacterized protein n=1 Tax=Schistosoma margrebowiei TaxID=48269 RepID=A0A183N356_9TREM|nr:unnamed protein product [Schistosoma margrebowiei]
MLSESNHDRKHDAVLIYADYFNDSLFFNEILSEFEENISEKSNSDVKSNVICLHSGFIPNECDKYVPNESSSSHIPDVIVSHVGYSHNQCMLSRIPSQSYDQSEGIESYPEIVRKPVYPDMKFAKAGNPNGVQDYPDEYEAGAYFPFNC